MFSQMTRIGLVVVAATLLAACSASPNSPQVASLGGATTTTTAAAGPSGSDQMAKDALAFSACMRQHGVKNFPDPQISGNGASIKIGGSTGLNRNDPTFQSAQKACQKYMQAGIGANGGAKADPTKIAAWASCMRSHGLPHFPDPTINSSNGAMQLNMTGSGVDPQSSTFSNAMKACQSLSPGGGIMVQDGNPGGGQ